MGFKIKDSIEFGGGISLRRNLATEPPGLYITGDADNDGGRAATLGLASGATVFNERGEDVDFRIEGDSEASLFALDGGLNTIGIGGAAQSGVQLAVELDTTGTAFHCLSLRGNDGAAGADADNVFQTFYATNDAGTAVEIGRLSAVYTDVSAAADKSAFTFNCFVNNAAADVMTLGTQTNSDATAQLAGPQGTTALPSFTALGDLDTGMNISTDNQIELCCGGAADFTVTTSACTAAGTLSATGRLTASEALTIGTGFDGAQTTDSGIFAQGTVIRTVWMIDLTDLVVSTTVNDIIGETGGTANCHFGQITAAVNGSIVGGVVICLEAPAGADDDIDIYSATEATGAENSLITDLTETALLTRGASWAAGDVVPFTAFPAANEYLYMANGVGGGAGTFTAGKFLIEMYGT